MVKIVFLEILLAKDFLLFQPNFFARSSALRCV